LLLFLSSSFQKIPVLLAAKAPTSRLRLPKCFALVCKSVFLFLTCLIQLKKRGKLCLLGCGSRHVLITGSFSELKGFLSSRSPQFPQQTCRIAYLGRFCTRSKNCVRSLSRNFLSFSCRSVPCTALITLTCHTLLKALFQPDKTFSSNCLCICEAELVL